MDADLDKNVKKNGTANGLSKSITVFQWSKNVTFIDLSNRHLSKFDDEVNFPPELVQINLSNNSFTEVPAAVLNINHLKILNMSFNNIKSFDIVPNFLHSIEELNLANNNLAGPPYWVWFEFPSQLKELNLNSNINIISVLKEDYFEQILQCNTLITVVKMVNCSLQTHKILLQTFPKAKELEIGTADFNCLMSNRLEQIPCQGLDRCCDIERLNASNTHIYNIDTSIDIYKALVEINLSQNHIRSLPNEFCNLRNLEICILSSNCILYLPDDIVKMKKLVCLRIDCNELCMLPENVSALENLKVLDLYDNVLYEVPEWILSMQELDLALNYMDEPNGDNYLEKKEKLRLNVTERGNGRKVEVEIPESVRSSSITDDEELSDYSKDMNETGSTHPNQNDDDGNMSSEDWDSDEYWVPHYIQPRLPPQSQWIQFVKRKMQEGNFCPMDLHIVSISEKVKYDKMKNPKPFIEVEGQFDDYSSDES